MRVFISADMEGISGIATLEDVSKGEHGYDRAAERMAADVNAAVEGALEAGAEDVLVNDSHASMANVDPGDLHEAATLIRGKQKPRSMMQGVAADHDVAFFVGYHAKAGTPAALLNHTYYGSEIVDVRVDGRLVGELGANAGLARSMGVPVGLVTGDDKTVVEAEDELEDVETVAVKTGIERFTAACRPLEDARTDIRRAATRAVERAAVGDFEQPPVPEPVTMEIDWVTTNFAVAAVRAGGVEPVDGRTVRLTGETYSEAFERLIAAIRAATAGRPG